MMYGTIENECLTVTVAEQGAELQSIRDSNGLEYLWQGNPEYWSGRAINLFPYVARLSDGKYSLDGKQYAMGIHGFAVHSRFSLVEKSSQQMVWELTDTEETYAQYPRHFRFRIGYQLDGNSLNVSFEVENRDDRTMYFGLGGHPGFNVPLVSGLSFDDYQLTFHEDCQPKRIGFSEKKLRSGKDTPFELEQGQVLPLRHELFDDDAIVLKEMAQTVTLGTKKDDHKITLHYPDMPYLGIWHRPKTEAPYVCIEPWCSLPASEGREVVFETQSDLIRLEPDGHYENHWSIQIS